MDLSRSREDADSPRRLSGNSTALRLTRSVKRESVSFVENAPQTDPDTTEIPRLTDFHIGPKWLGGSSGKSVVHILKKGDRRGQLHAPLSDDSATSSDEGLSPCLREATKSLLITTPVYPKGATFQGKTPDTIWMGSSSGEVWLGKTTMSKKSKQWGPKEYLANDKRWRPDSWPGRTAMETEPPFTYYSGYRSSQSSRRLGQFRRHYRSGHYHPRR